MNKRILLALLLVLLLCGCQAMEPIISWTDAETTSAVLSSDPTEAVPTIWETEPEASVVTAPVETQLQDTEPPEPAPEDFVLVTDYIPDLIVELKYASEDNFTGTVIYDFQEAYLRYGTVCKLMLVQQELRSMGLSMKLWDGFRPPKAQYRLWQICPDPVYVSDPNKGFSNHSRGDTVDITLVDSQGRELEMPTGFDDFSDLADRDYSDCSATAAANALLLQQLMEKYGFTGYRGEWWHYSDDDYYPVEMEFLGG